MIRFTSTQLRPIFSQVNATQRPVLLEKNLGIYIRVPDDNRPGEWLKAWAVGCNPQTDADWSSRCNELIKEDQYSQATYLRYDLFGAVLNDQHDLCMVPTTDIGGGKTIMSITRSPEPCFVLVEKYRDNIRWLQEQSSKHFYACVNDEERRSWRSQAVSVLDKVIRLDCKRVKPADRENFERAVRSVRQRLSDVRTNGAMK